MPTPGDRLRSARAHKGMSQRQLANLAGCALSTISRLENNQISDPSLWLASRVCAKLNVSIDWYWTGTGIDPSLPDRILQAVKKVLDKTT